MENIQKQTSKHSLDLFKFIMSVFVIAIHTGPLNSCANKSVQTIYELIVRMAVPFFFLTSGYLLASKFESFESNKLNTAIVRNYLGKIFRMYVIWSVAYIPLAIHGYYLEKTPVFRAILSYIRNLLLVGEHYNSWHLWYLLSVIYGLIFILIAFRFKIKPKNIIFISILIGLISVGIDTLVKSEAELPGVLLLAKKGISLLIVNGRILQGMVFLPIGMALAHKEIPLKMNIAIFLVGFISNYFVENVFLSGCLLIVTAVSLFGIVLRINLKSRHIYPVMRKLSAKVYLIHMYVWTFYYLIVYRTKQYGLDSFLVTTAVSFAIAYVLLLCEKRIKCMRLEK